MGRTLNTCLAFLAAAAMSGGAWADAKAPVADPPPPASLENHDVEAWAAAHLRTDGWTLLTHDLEGAHLASAKGVQHMPDGLVEIDIRTELFHPVQISPGPARSGVARWSVDCARKRLAILSMTAYSHNNLEGELAKKPVGATHAWQDPNESESVTIGVICSAARSGKGFTPKPLAPLSPS